MLSIFNRAQGSNQRHALGYLAGRMLFFALFMVFNVQSASLKPKVTVMQGQISGIHQGGLSVFKGIPYAAAPIGELRWQPPQPPSHWQGVLDASQFNNQCMQTYIYDDMKFRSKGVSEDCLYLNIWTASIDPSKKMPVLVYLYGGGFIAGDGSERRYDGAAMAQQDIVVVTVNYRLGLFGLLAHPDLSEQSSYKGSGNYSFLDQQAALQWVVDNIGHFGGDPKRITLAGESAGSMSVSAHLVSARSKDLIAAAIGQSGSMLLSPFPAVTLQQAHKQGADAVVKLAKALKLASSKNVLQQLRSQPAETLLNTAYELHLERFSATVDGNFLTDMPEQLYAKGEFSKVPLLTGVNSQEGAYQWVLGEADVNLENYQQAIKRLYPADYQQVLALYPADTNEQIMAALQDLASDRFISFGNWYWAQQMAKKSPKPVYYYLYDHVRPARKATEGGTGEHQDRGAVHSAEIEYALGNLDVNPLYDWQKEDYAVSKIMQQYFLRFINTGNPNSIELTPWPQFDSGQLLRIKANPASESYNLYEKRYQFHLDQTK
ncbi:carboxylesterase/lipase family protein [Aliiglaciecola sp. LCG003]|uniref:carboxylesterase/lipase family protein n=1 Tax=Aliiglaciecola sp. LCG003 TaxID=3053655 RepID=UPI002572F095|nr:carboxylesterase/lipase family protein [Aliiglaciecola sp. LCG003]WJG10310.1 carboxylesterase/lipase family protein [Aliiglaciecola sp. LCG003]